VTALIDVTEKAAQKGRELLAKKGLAEGAIRVKVLSGGCSGMSYHLEPAGPSPETGEQVVEAHGLRVYLHPKSLLYLAGTTLDYEQTIMNQRFVFKNPNAKTTCSCGESFST
jgi:iron-sulfur cluster assembly protein